jgi:hypothetical protein
MVVGIGYKRRSFLTAGDEQADMQGEGSALRVSLSLHAARLQTPSTVSGVVGKTGLAPAPHRVLELMSLIVEGYILALSLRKLRTQLALWVDPGASACADLRSHLPCTAVE